MTIFTRKPSADLHAQLTRWKNDRMSFRKEAVIMPDGRPFGACMEVWQEADYAALDSGVYRNGYLERPRGHSKTFDLGVEAACSLILGPKNQRLYCCASDQDQARLLFDDVVGIFQRNPVLAASVSITKKSITVRSTGSTLTPLADDAPGAYGLRPDGVFIDEPVEWTGDGLWLPLWTATGKRPHCRVLAISTAGFDKTGIGWQIREIARSEPDWLLSARGQCASWIKPEWLEQQRRTLPLHVYARLHEARWVDGVGAFLTSDEVEAIFSDVPEIVNGAVAIGLDIGLTNDRTVASVVRDVNGVLVVQHLSTWAGAPGRKVDLSAVEEEVSTLARRYGATVYVDPYQAVSMTQRLRRAGINTIEYPFTGESRKKLFATLLDLIRGRRLRSQPHDDLKRELLSLEVSESAGGWRVDHKTGRHDDHVVAVALAAQALAGQTGIDLAELETIAEINARMPNTASLAGTPGSILGTDSDLSRLIDAQRAAHVVNTGGEERPIDWTTEFW